MSGTHRYPDPEGTSDCLNGCGCWMGPFRSGGPEGVDPFGDCPKALQPVKGPITVNRLPASEAGSCNRCSYRSGEVTEIQLGPGRLTFRLCSACCEELAPRIGPVNCGRGSDDGPVELAGELALAWCREQLALVRGKASFFPASDHPAFQAGFAAAVEDFEERLAEARFSEILAATVAGLEAPR